jgi:urease accessory protein
MIPKAAVFILTLFSPLAMAHTGGAEAGGWVAGLMHPLLGLDHLLAMFAVGMLGARMGGRALWRLPLLFVGMLLMGAVLALNGHLIPYMEQGIALSVVLFGLMVALPRVSAGMGAALVAGFALYHGMAHGAEMPLAAVGLAYLAGMAVSTALLHLAGILSVSRLQAVFARAGGVAIAAGGLVLAVV